MKNRGWKPIDVHYRNINLRVPRAGQKKDYIHFVFVHLTPLLNYVVTRVDG